MQKFDPFDPSQLDYNIFYLNTFKILHNYNLSVELSEGQICRVRAYAYKNAVGSIF